MLELGAIWLFAAPGSAMLWFPAEQKLPRSVASSKTTRGIELESAAPVSSQELRKDPRWQLVERILATEPFRKSARSCDLLRYLAERAILNQSDDLTETKLGHALFGKAIDYSPTEDSTVRVHVRQLRLKLHEYFDGDGRNESWVVEIPKGSYSATFRLREAETQLSREKQTRPQFMQILPWGLAVAFLLTTILAWNHRYEAHIPQTAPWPLATLFQNGNQPVQIVVADANYGMLNLMNGHQASLQDYLSPAYRTGQEPRGVPETEGEQRIRQYLSRSILTSYADLAVVDSLLRLDGLDRSRLVLRPAKSLQARDMEDGSFVLIGGPASNPWVSYFQDRLNFRERNDSKGRSAACFDNVLPAVGEPQSYCGLPFTGSSGVDYATISLLPLSSSHGSTLIIQGLQQEGTEAAGAFLADPANRQKLQSMLGVSSTDRAPVYFEALLQIKSVQGAPIGETSIVTARRLKP